MGILWGMKICLWICSVVLGLGVMAQGAPQAQVRATVADSSIAQGERGDLAVVIDIPAGYHAQSNTPSSGNYIKLEVLPAAQEGVEFGSPDYPRGEDQEYPLLGKLNVYTGTITVNVPFVMAGDAEMGQRTIRGKVRYQLCDDKACYFPENQPFEAQLTITQGTGSAVAALPATIGGNPAGADWSIWTAFGAAFVAGLLFNVMPCVLPVLPLKAIGFYEVSQHRRGRSFMLGVVFSVGLIAIFAVLAMLVLVLRVISWGELFSRAWFIWPMVALLAVMGLGLLGAFTVSLPTAAYRFSPRHDTFGGNFFWGALTAILATPCTAPLLPALLLWAASHPAIVGVPAMLMVGVGMASPYLILSAFPDAARRFPRSGPWAELFKQMMGFLLLVAAMYFGAGRAIHGPGFWWLVSATVAVAGFYLMARTVQLTRSAGAVAISSVLAVAMIGASLWWTAKMTGLGRPMLSGGEGQVESQWEAYTPERFERAKSEGKIVLVKFTANWCATCQYIEGTVYQDPQIWRALRRHEVVAFKADMTDSELAKPLLLQLNPAGGIPLTAIYAPKLNGPIVLASVYGSDDLLRALDAAAGSPMVKQTD
jgi:thiol:disulfide interchange protein DsbD